MADGAWGLATVNAPVSSSPTRLYRQISSASVGRGPASNRLSARWRVSRSEAGPGRVAGSKGVKVATGYVQTTCGAEPSRTAGGYSENWPSAHDVTRPPTTGAGSDVSTSIVHG